MLRKAILAYGVLALLGGIGLAVAGILTGLVVYLCVNGAIVIAAAGDAADTASTRRVRTAIWMD